MALERPSHVTEAEACRRDWVSSMKNRDCPF